MQPFCATKMKIARELLDYGVFSEGAENLSRLHNCGRSAGCDHWHRCIRMIEGQWLSLKPARQAEQIKA